MTPPQLGKIPYFFFFLKPSLTVLLECEHEAGEHEDGDADDDQDEAEVLVGLVQGIHQTLQSHKVANHLENAENAHNPDNKKVK